MPTVRGTDSLKMVVLSQWVLLAAALGFGFLWTPAFLMLCWTVPWIAVIGNRSAFGYPIYSPVAFLFGPISAACWVLGWVGFLGLMFGWFISAG